MSNSVSDRRRFKKGDARERESTSPVLSPPRNVHVPENAIAAVQDAAAIIDVEDGTFRQGDTFFFGKDSTEVSVFDTDVPSNGLILSGLGHGKVLITVAEKGDQTDPLPNGG